MLRKNDIIRLEIASVSNEGNGVGRYEGIVIFVPFTAPGDVIDCKIVKVCKSFCYGIVLKIITPSSDRCESFCKVYGKCGGCCFRHINYSAELRYKKQFVIDAFSRIGGSDIEIEEIIGSERTVAYRNKAQFPVSCDENGKVFAGFFSKRSHRVIKLEKCALIPDIFSKICDDIIEFANLNNIKAYNESDGSGFLRHIFIRRGERGENEMMIALVVTDLKKADIFYPLSDMLCKKYSSLRSFIINENAERTNVIIGKKSRVIFGREYIYDEMCGNKIALSLHSFYQINTFQAEKIYKKAEQYAMLGVDELLLDLYCGAGTIGLSMAWKVKKLIGVEIVPQAVENAKLNAKNNNIENAEFICADAEKAAQMLIDKSPDVIIADPARKGCTPATLNAMAKMQPKRIVMISCNPATAARDCAVLSGLGYKIEKCACADLFPRTEHVECVVLMSRVDEYR